MIVEGEGAWLRDRNGKEFLDGLAGLWCVNVGYGRRGDRGCEYQQAQVTLPYFHSFASMGNGAGDPAGRAPSRSTRRRGSIACSSEPRDRDTKNDTAMKMVWYFNNLRGKPDKKKIIARDRAYNGVEILDGGCLTGLSIPCTVSSTCRSRASCPPRAPYPYRNSPADESPQAFARRLAGDLEKLIQSEGPGTVAAFIAEPVMGAGGVIVPPESYCPRSRKC